MDGDLAACPLPGHAGTASLDTWRGELALWCDCFGAERFDGGRAEHSYPLSDAYRAIRAGIVLPPHAKPLARGGRFVWRLLLAHEVGVVEPVAIHMPAVEGERDRRVAALFAELAGLRLAVGSELPMPFSVSLVMEACGLASRRAAHNAIKRLCEAGTIVKAGDGPARGGRRGAALYLPPDTCPKPCLADLGNFPP